MVPIKPGAREKIQATTAATTAAIRADPAFDSLLEVSYFFTDDDKMVARSVFSTMESLKNSAEATKKVMGGMAEHFAGPPSMSMGTVDWHFKGPAAPVATPVSRVTIVPIKPGAQGAIMTKNMIETIEKGLDDPAMAGLIEVATIFSGDNLISRSLFTDAGLGRRSRCRAVMGAMKEHFAGPPTRLSELAWHHARPAARPRLQRRVWSPSSPTTRPAGFAVASARLGISAGAPAGGAARTTSNGAASTWWASPRRRPVQRLPPARPPLDFAMASDVGDQRERHNLWRKFVTGRRRDGGAGWYDELGRLGKPTTPAGS